MRYPALFNSKESNMNRKRGTLTIPGALFVLSGIIQVIFPSDNLAGLALLVAILYIYTGVRELS